MRPQATQVAEPTPQQQGFSLVDRPERHVAPPEVGSEVSLPFAMQCDPAVSRRFDPASRKRPQAGRRVVRILPAMIGIAHLLRDVVLGRHASSQCGGDEIRLVSDLAQWRPCDEETQVESPSDEVVCDRGPVAMFGQVPDCIAE